MVDECHLLNVASRPRTLRQLTPPSISIFLYSSCASYQGGRFCHPLAPKLCLFCWPEGGVLARSCVTMSAQYCFHTWSWALCFNYTPDRACSTLFEVVCLISNTEVSTAWSVLGIVRYTSFWYVTWNMPVVLWDTAVAWRCTFSTASTWQVIADRKQYLMVLVFEVLLWESEGTACWLYSWAWTYAVSDVVMDINAWFLVCSSWGVDSSNTASITSFGYIFTSFNPYHQCIGHKQQTRKLGTASGL